MTEYVILHRLDETDTWELYASREASSPTRAIRLLGEPNAGEYVAIPKRSWKPVSVKVENTVKVTIG